MNATLFIAEPGRAERAVELKRTATIGRTAENDIVIESEGVSRRHALLLVRGETAILIDLGSTNGTFVNGVQALPQQQVPLKPGDQITIGRATLRYTVAAQPGPTRLPPPTVVAGLPPRRPPSVRPRRPLPPSDGRIGPRPAGAPIDPGRFLRYLPAIYHNDDLLDRFLRGCEDLLAPIERTIDNLEYYLDPRIAPADLVDWLAFWVGLSVEVAWPADRRRALIMEAAGLYPWRGTRRGLSRAIQIATGYTPEIVEPQPRRGVRRRGDEQWHLFRVILRVPDPNTLDRAIIEAVIEAQKPAHTAYLLEIVADTGARAAAHTP